MSITTPPDALRRIEECRTTSNTKLDLSKCELTEVPSELADFIWLEKLNLSINQISEVKNLDQLTALTELELYSNRIGEIKNLEALTKLTRLILDNNQICEIENLDSLKNLVELDLSFNQISEIKNLVQQTVLAELYLHANKIVDIKNLDRLTGLRKLHLSSNKIGEIKNLNQLTSLTELHLRSNQISEIKNLDRLTALTSLDLSVNRISEIKNLDALSTLLELDFFGNLISEIKNLDQLTTLTSLNFSSNQISEIENLDYLIKLKDLDFYENDISEIKNLEKLSELRQLSIASNQISEIRNLDKLSELLYLNLDKNQIKEIKNLDKLSKLTNLQLSRNQINEITGLDELKELTVLSLYRNKIKSLSGLSISLMNKIEEIDLSGNPIRGTTVTDWKNPKAILGYLESQQDTLVPNYHLKVNIIGEGRIGKTQLFNYWSKQPYTTNEEPTRGTMTTTLSLPGSQYKATIWDFGGQAYHHGFHHVFLRPNDFYLVLWRKELKNENPDYAYWLGTARNFSRPTDKEFKASIVLIQNLWTETDESDRQEIFRSEEAYIPERQKMEVYGLAFDNIFAIDVRSLHKNYPQWKWRHDYFLNSIYQKMVEHVQKLLPEVSEKWLAIKEKLDKNPILDIGLDKTIFQALHAPEFDDAALAGLLDYLEFTGNIIKFPEPSTLSDYVFPNPPALSDWIYGEILNKELIEEDQGIIKYSYIQQERGEDEAKIFLEIMNKFNLLFTEKGNDDNLVIPQFLPENNNSFKRLILELIPYSFCIRFADFFHESRMFQFISEYGEYADDKTSYWRYGLVFTIDHVNALVYYNQEERIVFVHLNNKRGRIEIAQKIFNYFVFKQTVPLYTEKKLYYFARKYKIRIDTLAEIATKNGFEIKPDPNAIVSFEAHSLLANKLQWEGWHNELRRIAYGLRDQNTMLHQKLDIDDLIGDDIIEGAQLSINREHYIDIKETLRSNAEEISIGIDVKSRQKIRLDSLTLNLLGVMNQQAKKVFISYSQQDESYKDEFKKHLVTLIHENKVSTFDDRQLSLGGDWDSELKRKIDECDIMVCLISVDFLNTGYIMKTEVPRALEMGKTVVPILVRPCDWAESMLGVKNGVLKAKEISLFEEKNDRHMPVFRSSTREERDMFWLQVIKEFREKAFKNEG